MAPDAVGEEGARAQVARDQLLDVRVPDFVQGGVFRGAALVFWREYGKYRLVKVAFDVPRLC